MNFKGIDNIDTLIKEADEFSQSTEGQSANNRVKENYSGVGDDTPANPYDSNNLYPNNSDDPEFNSEISNEAKLKGIVKQAQEDVELLNGDIVEKGELIKWYNLVRANIYLIQEILDNEE